MLYGRPTPASASIEFRGYAYDAASDALGRHVDSSTTSETPQIWKVPLRDELVPAVTVTAPRAGYIVDGGFAPLVAALLDAHGIRYAQSPRREPRLAASRPSARRR